MLRKAAKYRLSHQSYLLFFLIFSLGTLFLLDFVNSDTNKQPHRNHNRYISLPIVKCSCHWYFRCCQRLRDSDTDRILLITNIPLTSLFLSGCRSTMEFIKQYLSILICFFFGNFISFVIIQCKGNTF